MSSLVIRRRLRSRRPIRKRRSGGRFLRILLIGVLSLLLLGALAVAAGVGTVFAVYQHYAGDYVPIEAKLRQTHIGLTQVYDRGGPEEGQHLGHLSNPDAQLLAPVPLEEISDWMVTATISTEDNSFWTHPGVNLRGLMRAAYENYVANEFGEGTGGSSITQQLIKTIYICPQFSDTGEVCEAADRTVDRKLREIAYAIELERDYTKEQILGWYLNQISYADRYVGVQAAAQGYFHKDAADLELHEAALLAGIPSSPGIYHPRVSCVVEEGTDDVCATDDIGRTRVGGAAKERQEIVLDLMVEHKHITASQAEAAKQEPLDIYPRTKELTAPEYIDNWVEPRLVRMCEAGLLEKLEGVDDCFNSVHSAGYQVTTALDWEATQDAEALIQERIAAGLDAGCNCHNASVVTIDPQSGEMLVYVPNVGGTSTDPRVAPAIDQAVEIRQPGSAFKPLIFLAWFDALNKTPASTFWDTNNLQLDGAVIRNPRADIGTEGLITARQALGGSQNVASVRAAHEAGLPTVIEYAKRMGITTLDQSFDPTFLDHERAYYGPSIATGGANIRVADLAYMNATIANMGEMVGVPHLAEYVELDELQSVADENSDPDTVDQQAIDFRRGNIRIPGTRSLDPIVVLEVRDVNGNVIFEQGEPEREQVVDAGSVWLLHSIMSDCNARLLIWACGNSNDDTRLDFFADGVQVPAGAKTGTQQGPLSASDTLSTWMAGYSRYAASALWVGNANNELINDGPGAGYASAHTTIRLYKSWMGQYHEYLQSTGKIGDEFLGFDGIQPDNVEEAGFLSPATDRGHRGGCNQTITTWQRTDISYEPECKSIEIDTRNGLLAGPNTSAQYRTTRRYVPLPDLGTDLARELARRMGIPIAPTETSRGAPAVSIASPVNGATITEDTNVVGSVGSNDAREWELTFGRGGSPGSWTTLGSGSGGVSNSTLGTIVMSNVTETGVYTLQLTVRDAILGEISTSVQINVVVGGPPEPEPGDEEPDEPGGDQPGGSDTPTPPPTATTHPLAYELCGHDPDCGGATNIIVRCGPNGWFADPNREWSSNDWPRFIVQTGPDAQAVRC